MTHEQLCRAFPGHHPDVLKALTVITSQGQVLRQGEGGFVVVDNDEHRPVLIVDETSDNETTNLFLYTAAESSGISKVIDGESHNLYDICLNR